MLKNSRRPLPCGAVVALVALVALVAATDAFEIPVEVLTHMRGDWNVEVATPCVPTFVSGAVSITNESSLITLSSGANNETLLLSQPSEGGTGAVLTLRGLEPFLFSRVRGSGSLHYSVCRRQSNFMSTEKRPVFGSRMAVTQLTELTAVIGEDKTMDDLCTGDGVETIGEVTIRLVGMPMDDTMPEKGWKQREAIQYAEVIIDARDLPDSCAARIKAERATGGGDAAHKKKTRKRRGLRNTVGTSEASSEDAEAAVANGLTVIRFSKRSPPSQSSWERYYPSLMFAGMFVIYRLVYGYSSNKASK